MKILVACEESQAVTIELRKLGHIAFSADTKDPSGEHPEWHIKGDVSAILNGGQFDTMNGDRHKISTWDMIIAFPPCTYLTKAGACNIPKDPTRINKGHQAAEFFYKIWNANCPRIAIENPVPMKRFGLPNYTQIVHPYEFGHPALKPTCLWLKGLPNLSAINGIPRSEVPRRVWTSPSTGIKRTSCAWFDRSRGQGEMRSTLRSKTFSGIAIAMATQWTTEKFDIQMTMF